MPVKELSDVLRAIQPGVFVALALLALRRWRSRPDQRAGWLAATFSVLGVVVLAGLVLPRHSDSDVVAWARKLLIPLLVLFPYFLYRFMASFGGTPRWLDRAAIALTAAAALGVLPFDRLPETGEPRSASFEAYLLLIVFQWALLSGVVGVRLWRAGANQPTVARRRMRTLSLGSLGLALALVVAGAGPATDEASVQQVIVQFLALLSAPLFLLGAAPPGIVLAAWRRPELAELQEAERALMEADRPSAVAGPLLPHAARILGGRAALLVDCDGRAIASYGLSVDEAGETAARVAGRDGSGIVGDGSVLAVPMEAGWLVVLATPYTPYFGQDEAAALKALAVYTDLALARTELAQRERVIAEELKTANESLTATNEAMKEFVAIASHDLRTPITVIQGFTAMMEGQWGNLEDDQKRKYIASIERQAQHLSRLVNDLLTISQIDAGAVEPRAQALELKQLVERALEGLGDRRTGIGDAVPSGLKIWGDEEHVFRILGNYISNALAYGGPPIHVEAQESGDSVEICVVDHGAGVPPDFRPRLFEKFARADKKLSKATQGTGLGLSIVRGLARAGGGDAWYEPNTPSGSRFIVRFPAVPERDDAGSRTA